MNRPIQQRNGPASSGDMQPSPVSLAELQRAVWSADPAALLILPRLLRRVIRQHRELSAGLGLSVPHRKSYVIARQPLLEIVDVAELGCGSQDALPEQVILLERPSQEDLAETPGDETLVRFWRLLFHARVHAALEPVVLGDGPFFGPQAVAAIGKWAENGSLPHGPLTPILLRQRIQQIGPVEFDEARTVLSQERLLLPPRDDATAYVELAAVYLELKYFAPSLLPRYFPSLSSTEKIDRVLRQDLDGDAIFRATMLPGAPLPEDEIQAANTASRQRGEYLWDPAKWHWAEPKQPPEIDRPSEDERKSVEPPVSAEARSDIDDLLRRLPPALGIDDESMAQWREPLLALAAQAPSGARTPEARLLGDLKKVCVDHEREVSKVDLVEWALSFGRRPVRRPLPHLREVLLSKHLRSAAGRLAATSISDSQRRAIGDLLRSATERAEAGLRDRFRPLIVGALDDVDLQPHNLAERVARKKLVEELLDRIVDRGFLTLGDLRDALSRNNLKQPDFYRLRDLFHGDALLRTDQRLAVALDGVYQRGEFYLRWMQQISSLAFGTRTGRFFTRYAAVPFGGAYLALAFMEHLIKLLFGRDFEFEKPVPVLLLGTLFLTLLYIDWFRNGLGRIIVTSATTLRDAGLGSARWLMQLPLVQFVICSQLVTFAMRFLVKPLALTAIIWAVTPLEKANWRTSAGGGVTLFFGLNMFLNSRLGRTVEEVLSDWIVEGWHRIGVRFLAGLFWWIVDLFRGILQAIERALYAVEQWLRLKSGQSKTIFVVKAALGVAWFFVAYVIRFCINLLIEPQINPIKHFPVVTVAHKLLLPLIPHLAGVLEATMEKGVAYTVATTVIAGIPGICGFLVWELRENWRLYAANRPRNLQPSLIGPHFETMIRLLKPGIHSGTLPKRYAKLRRAERHARANGNWKGLRKHLQALDRVELSIRRYAERELIELLCECGLLADHIPAEVRDAQDLADSAPLWLNAPYTVGEIRLGVNRIKFAVQCPSVCDAALWITLELKGGWLVADSGGPSWATQLALPQRRLVLAAVAGLYHTSGVEVVRQQIEAAFSPPPPAYDLVQQGLIVWPDDSLRAEMLYDLRDGSLVTPLVVDGMPSRILPTLDRRRLLFSDTPLPWRQWVRWWEPDGAAHERMADAIVPLDHWESDGLADAAIRR